VVLVGAQREDHRIGIAPRDEQRGQEQLGGAAAVRGCTMVATSGASARQAGVLGRGIARDDGHHAMRGRQPRGAVERALERRRPAARCGAGEDEAPDVRRHTRADGGAVAKESNVGDH